MKELSDFEKQMLIYRINNLKNLGNKDFMVSFASIVNDYDLLQKDDYKNLQDHDWCRDSFKHEYTVIKALSKDVAERKFPYLRQYLQRRLCFLHRGWVDSEIP